MHIKNLTKKIYLRVNWFKNEIKGWLINIFAIFSF